MLDKLIEKVGSFLQTDRNTATIALAAAAVAVVLGLLCWIFSAVGLGVIAKRREVKGRWMGWFPLFNVILLGRLADHYLDEVKGISTDKRQSLPALEIALVLATAAAGVLWSLVHNAPAISDLFVILAGAVSACAVVVWIIFLVQMYSACYHIYYSCTPDDAKLLTVLTVVFPVLMPFFLFGLRRKANGMPPRRMLITK